MMRLRWLAWPVGLILSVVAVGCGIAVKRNLSAVPPGQVGFDDMCGLQGYFDALEIHTSPPPRVVSALDLEAAGDGGRTVRGGKERFAFENDFQLKHLRRVLGENWKRLPEPVANASTIEVEVKWSEKAGTKRVVTDEEALLSAGVESWGLPYHPCLSELLYGEPLYRQRRVMWGLPLPGMPAHAAELVARPARDGGAIDATPARD
jgi:hypothetical protein